VWVNEKTRWIYPELEAAHERMTELSRRFDRPAPIEARALRQAGRELLLAQASDWPFILNAGTSPDYARQRVTEHLSRFNTLYKQLNSGACDETWLARTEAVDNLLPELNYRYWR
jgi:1,4-alpha-glucan branching enzyme